MSHDTNIMDLSELKRSWKENDFYPKKKLGQNFLIDKNIRDKIIEALKVTSKTVIIEVGSGFGVMTLPLADICRKIIAVEKDSKIYEIMRTKLSNLPNVEFVRKDIMDLDICSAIPSGRKGLIFGNIPYYISSPLIEKIINAKDYLEEAFIVIQKELADRIVAGPGTKDYSSLSCYVQFYTKPAKLFKIKANSFFPKPGVESALLKLTILGEPSVKVKNAVLMFDIIHKAFSQRRKKIENALSKNFDSCDIDWKEAISSCNIDPFSRAENLSLEAYARLCDKAGDML